MGSDLEAMIQKTLYKIRELGTLDQKELLRRVQKDSVPKLRNPNSALEPFLDLTPFPLCLVRVQYLISHSQHESWEMGMF